VCVCVCVCVRARVSLPLSLTACVRACVERQELKPFTGNRDLHYSLLVKAFLGNVIVLLACPKHGDRSPLGTLVVRLYQVFTVYFSQSHQPESNLCKKEPLWRVIFR